MSDREARHVVVVDDDPLFRRFVVRALEKQRLRVSPAEGFSDAMKIIESEEPVDLLVTDVRLGIDIPHGVTLSNMAQLKRRGLKVILMTGAYDAQQVAAYGNPLAVLQKPFVSRTLVEAVMAALEPSPAL